MKVLEEYEDLEGKKIIFSHMAQFAQQITLATECGCVLMVIMNTGLEFSDEKEIEILSECEVIATIKRNSFIRKSLTDLGIL